MSISEDRCFNHAFREAVARCPQCGRAFCRECVSEHEDRVICAFCLKRFNIRDVRRRRLALLVPLLQTLAGVLLLWSSFYLLGKVLLTIPSSFHEGAVWQQRLVDR